MSSLSWLSLVSWLSSVSNVERKRFPSETLQKTQFSEDKISPVFSPSEEKFPSENRVYGGFSDGRIVFRRWGKPSLAAAACNSILLITKEHTFSFDYSIEFWEIQVCASNLIRKTPLRQFTRPSEGCFSKESQTL